MNKIVCRKIVCAVALGVSLCHLITPAHAAPGDHDPTFDPGITLNGGVFATAIQPDGKVLVGGVFDNVGNSNRDFICRFEANGTLDTTFNPAVLSDIVLAVALQPDGKILVGGSFLDVGGDDDRICRLNADGTQDLSFNPQGLLLNGNVGAIVIQPDGKILVGGSFLDAGGDDDRICRLEVDGSHDASFDPQNRVNQNVRSIALQPDGKILLGGQFTNVGTGLENDDDRICRLNSDGTHDPSFDPDDRVSSTVQAVVIQPDGKVLIAGDFTNLGGGGGDRVGRLNSDGSHDASFNPGTLVGDTVFGLALQTDGKVLISGGFLNAGGDDDRVCRLAATGAHDATFNPADAIAQFLEGVAIQADGKVLFGGGFFAAPANGMGDDNFIARFESGAASSVLTTPSASRVQWLRGGTSPEATRVTFELSLDGGTTFNPLGEGSRIAGGWELNSAWLPQAGQIRARAFTKGGQYAGSSGIVEAIRVFSFTNAPRVTIKGPKTITTNRGTVTLRGTASDVDGDLVSVRFIDSRANGKRFRPTRGIASWSLVALLKPGRNTVQIQARDARNVGSAIQRVTVIRE